VAAEADLGESLTTRRTRTRRRGRLAVLLLIASIGVTELGSLLWQLAELSSYGSTSLVMSVAPAAPVGLGSACFRVRRPSASGRSGTAVTFRGSPHRSGWSRAGRE